MHVKNKQINMFEQKNGNQCNIHHWIKHKNARCLYHIMTGYYEQKWYIVTNGSTITLTAYRVQDRRRRSETRYWKILIMCISAAGLGIKDMGINVDHHVRYAILYNFVLFVAMYKLTFIGCKSDVFFQRHLIKLSDLFNIAFRFFACGLVHGCIRA